MCENKIHWSCGNVLVLILVLFLKEPDANMHYRSALTSAHGGGPRVCPCSIGSAWPASLWTCRTASGFATETSMLTGWKASGGMKPESGDAAEPLKSHWLYAPPCLLKITGVWPLSLRLDGILSPGGLGFAEAADWLGFRNLAHFWPVTISSSKLKDPRPNWKLVADLEKRIEMLSLKKELHLSQVNFIQF